MPAKKKTTSKKSVTKLNDRTEIYIIFILWMAIASVFMILAYMTDSLGFGANASAMRWERKYQNTRIPTPITTPYIKPTPVEPGVWPTPSVMNPESQRDTMMNQKRMPGMVPNPGIGERQ